MIRNYNISYKSSGKIRAQLRIWGSGRPFFIVSIIKRLAQKLRRIILPHFGLVTFGIHFRETRKPIIVMIFGPTGRDHDPQNQYYLNLETPRCSK